MKRSFVAVVVMALVGCGPTTRQYDVLVRNQSDRPMTVVLTKDGPPMDLSWLPPEDLAVMRQAPPEARVNGLVILPGESRGQQRGSAFDAGTNAVLRVYSGEQTPMTMLGISPGSPNRTDIPLVPGPNTIVIDRDGRAVRQ